jgi:hypothetical protein
MVAAHGVDGHARSLDMTGLAAAAEGFDVHVRRMARAGPGARGPGSGVGLAGLLLADLHGLAAAVPPAVGAGMVRLLGLVAVRALLQAGDREGVMRAALALARA